MTRRVIYKTLETAYALAASAVVAYTTNLPLELPDKVILQIQATGDISWIVEQGLIGVTPISTGVGIGSGAASSVVLRRQSVVLETPLPQINLVITEASGLANSLAIYMVMLWD